MTLISGFLLAIGGYASAQDAVGCEGLSAYRAEMFKVGKAFIAQTVKDGVPANRDVATFSSAEWTKKAADLAVYQADLEAIAPPPWLKNWHDLRIERAGLDEQIALAAASRGLYGALLFKGASDRIDAENKAATAAAFAACSDFAVFARDWDALDGDINGTPVATPSS